MIFVFDRIENIVGKGENAGYQHFLLFPQHFQNFKNLFTRGRQKLGLCGKHETYLFITDEKQFLTTCTNLS